MPLLGHSGVINMNLKVTAAEQRSTRPTAECANHVACNGSNGRRLLSVSLESEDNGH